MCEAYKLDMTAKNGYVWFLPEWLNKTWFDTSYFNKNFNESVTCSKEEMIKVCFMRINKTKKNIFLFIFRSSTGIFH